MTETAPELPRPWAERALSPIAEVRREEIPTALLLTLLMFLVLAAYYMRPAAHRAAGGRAQHREHLR